MLCFAGLLAVEGGGDNLDNVELFGGGLAGAAVGKLVVEIVIMPNIAVS